MQDVRRIERNLRAAANAGRLPGPELCVAALELAVALNVIELSPMGRLVRGSLAHERMRDALDALVTELETPTRIAA